MPDVPDELITLARVISEDQHLRAWFRHFEKLPVNLRLSALGHIAARMREHGENESLVVAVELLGRAEICAAVSAILGDVDA